MKITHLGHASFLIETQGRKILIDPYDPEMLGMKWKEQEVDIVCLTHDHQDHGHLKGVSGNPVVLADPGEYEIADVRIQGLAAYHDDKQGAERGPVTLFLIESEDMTIAHFGDIGHELLDEQEERLGEIDVLMIPVGGVFTINAKQAGEMIATIEPSVTIPMHYSVQGTKTEEWGLAPLGDFLKEMGVENAEPQKILELKNKATLPEESQVVILEPLFA